MDPACITEARTEAVRVGFVAEPSPLGDAGGDAPWPSSEAISAEPDAGPTRFQIDWLTEVLAEERRAGPAADAERGDEIDGEVGAPSLDQERKKRSCWPDKVASDAPT